MHKNTPDTHLLPYFPVYQGEKKMLKANGSKNNLLLYPKGGKAGEGWVGRNRHSQYTGGTTDAKVMGGGGHVGLWGGIMSQVSCP